MLLSVAQGSPPDDPVWGLRPCSTPPRLLQSRASFYRILSVALDAPVRGTWFAPGRYSPGASPVLHSAPVAPIRGVFLSYSLRCLGCSSPWHRDLPRTIHSGGLGRAPLRPGCSNPGRLFAIFSPLPRMLPSGASFCRILSVASDAAVRGTGFIPGRSSPGASAVLHSAPVLQSGASFFRILSVASMLQSVALGSPPDDPVRGLVPCFIPPRLLPSGSSFFSFSLRCLGCSSPWHPVLPRTIQSRGLGRAPLRPGCSNPGCIFIVFSPLPRMLQSVAPGSPPDDTVRGLNLCFIPPRLLQSGASFYRILSVASDAPVRGTGFPPGRSCPGARAVLHSAPVAPIRGFSLSYSLRCPGCSNPGRLFVVSSPLPQMLQSVALGSAPDDPVRGLVPCFIPPWLLQSGASFYGILSVALDAPVHGTWFTPRPSSPAASAVLHSAEVAPFLGVFLTYSLRCLGCSSPWHLVHPRMIQSGA